MYAFIQSPTHQPRIHQMMCFDEHSGLIGDLHDDWSLVVRDVDVEKTFGRVWVDVDSIV